MINSVTPGGQSLEPGFIKVMASTTGILCTHFTYSHTAVKIYAIYVSYLPVLINDVFVVMAIEQVTLWAS